MDTRVAVERPPSRDESRPAVSYDRLDDDSLIATLPTANIAGCLAILEEIRRRRLVEAIPELDRLCQRFRGFGAGRIVPEQAAALEALAAIGGSGAARVGARLIAHGTVQGAALRKAVRIAMELGATLPQETVLALLRHPDADVRTMPASASGICHRPMSFALARSS